MKILQTRIHFSIQMFLMIRLSITQHISPAEIFAMRYWLRYAATIGDISYLKITGCTLPPIPELNRPPFAVG